MTKPTRQKKIWMSRFGDAYTDRNRCAPRELDALYRRLYGVTKTAMNREFLGGLAIKNILEVGCGSADQLEHLQRGGYGNLYGCEISEYAIRKANELTKNINVVWGDIFDVPFKDNYFDLVFTAGVLIHVSPKDMKNALREMYRVSKKYIWGFEFWNDRHTPIAYRGYKNFLWKADFAQLYLDAFPHRLKLVKEKHYAYRDNGNIDTMFLLKKA